MTAIALVVFFVLQCILIRFIRFLYFFEFVSFNLASASLASSNDAMTVSSSDLSSSRT